MVSFEEVRAGVSSALVMSDEEARAICTELQPEYRRVMGYYALLPVASDVIAKELHGVLRRRPDGDDRFAIAPHILESRGNYLRGVGLWLPKNVCSVCGETPAKAQELY